MKMLKENLGELAVLTLKGEFDSFVTNAFTNEIEKVHSEGTNRIVLNMRLVKFVNSTALGAMIKARKASRGEGGDLVISEPSAAVREAMESLGLDRLFSIHDDDEAAIAALDQSDAVELDQTAESTLMIHIPEDTKPIVARLSRLEADALECRTPKADARLVKGREVRLKFRLPLYRKEFFELSARIEEVADDHLSLRYTQISDEDRDDIGRFVDDMGDLRKEVREST